ncbi:hypothetical protein JR316_0008992 [Psilocybe cubensis]|uniref:Uncharacterized protein n=2 Tax=Psilocybe cubensis TaxID=181762 RepID=A0A8H7XUJ1_PSICU|nr:hypothetical protein JR316_0008992 [Psilocybe cubensis]KAH9478537.1 hypothetical protein JR316_0008992 [Psilocybe cubensis]
MLHTVLRCGRRSLVRCESSVAARDYPINVIERQDSLRRLWALVHEEGNIPSAQRLLADILASSDGLDAYRHVCRTITHKPLLHQLALTAAQNGHARYARDEVLPLLDPSVRPELDQLLSAAESRLRPSPVFEDSAADYPAPAPPRPSTLDIIQQSLPALLPDPSTDDGPLFEDAATPVFAPLSEAAHLTNTSVGLLDRTLLSGRYEDAHALLVDMYDLGVPIPPSPKYAYVALALLQSTDPTAPLTQQQSDRIAAWLALIPPLHRTTRQSAPQTQTVLSLLDAHFLRTVANPDTRTIARLLSVLASLGYIDKFQRLVDITVRSLSPTRLPFFLNAIDAALVVYTTNAGLDTDKLPRARSIFRNRVVRTLALARRADEAVPLLVDVAHGLWVLHKPTIKLLHDVAAHDISLGHKDAPIPRVLELLDHAAPATTTLSPAELDALEERRPAVEDEVDFNGSVVLAARYLHAMLLTRTRVPHSKSIAAFMEMYIAQHGRTRILHTLFRRAHRGSGPITLLDGPNPTAKSNPAARITASTYALAEMLFYHRHRLYELVVETFVDHFYLFGVDRALVMERYTAHLARRASNPAKYPARITFPAPPPPRTSSSSDSYSHSHSHSTSTTNASASAGTAYLHTLSPFSSAKLFPEDTHCTLLWHALVRVTPRPRRKDVYMAFLRIAQAHVDIAAEGAEKAKEKAKAGKLDAVPAHGIKQPQKHPQNHLQKQPSKQPSKAPPAPPPPPPPSHIALPRALLSLPPSHTRITSASFTPFLEPLLEGYGARAGWRVVRDMLELGVSPEVYVWTEMGRVLARDSGVGVGRASRWAVLEEGVRARKERERERDGMTEGGEGREGEEQGEGGMSERERDVWELIARLEGAAAHGGEWVPLRTHGPRRPRYTTTTTTTSSSTPNTPPNSTSASDSTTTTTSSGEHPPAHAHAQGQGHWLTYPPPDLPFYTAILRGFIMARNTRAAARVVAHVRGRFAEVGEGAEGAGDKDAEGQGQRQRPGQGQAQGGKPPPGREMTPKEKMLKRRSEALYLEAVRDLEVLVEGMGKSGGGEAGVGVGSGNRRVEDVRAMGMGMGTSERGRGADDAEAEAEEGYVDGDGRWKRVVSPPLPVI